MILRRAEFNSYEVRGIVLTVLLVSGCIFVLIGNFRIYRSFFVGGRFGWWKVLVLFVVIFGIIFVFVKFYWFVRLYVICGYCRVDRVVEIEVDGFKVWDVYYLVLVYGRSL